MIWFEQRSGCGLSKSEPKETKVFLDRRLPPSGDLVFVSTDVYGNYGMLFRNVLKILAFPRPRLSLSELREQGYTVTALRGSQRLAPIVTVGRDDIWEGLLEAHLDSALKRIAHTAMGLDLWMPLMGTGHGGMSHMDSLQITAGALSSYGLTAGPRAARSIVISTGSKLTDEELAELRAAAAALLRCPVAPAPESADAAVAG